jgi:hypothetical protein
MRYYVPDIRVAADVPAGASQPVDQFGGLPWGLATNLWPKCSDCGKSQSLVAQLVHDPSRLDLGRDGRVLYVFQCNHDPGMCSTWQGGSGANACFVVEREKLTAGLAVIPTDKPPIDNEVRVIRWLERNDGVPSSSFDFFFDETAYLALPEAERTSVPPCTKLGGVPYWIQSASEAPKAPWHFIGQLDSMHSFLSPPNEQVSWVNLDEERWEGRTHYAAGPNFGDGGIAYLFLKQTGSVPIGWFFWQCG